MPDTVETYRDYLLIVDDDSVDRENIRRCLSHDVIGEVEVVDIQDGEQLLEFLNDNTPTCILLDQNLPGISGIDILTRLRALPQSDEISIVLLTGSNNRELAFEAFRQGAYDYIDKNEISESRLNDSLLRAFDRSRLKREARLAQIELQLALQTLREANHAQERLISELSHELRSPLTGLVGLVDLLDTTKLEKRDQEYVALMKNSSREALRLVDTILERHSLRFEEAENLRHEFALSDLITSIRHLLQSSLAQKSIELQVDVSDELDSHYIGNEHAIKQILLNFLSNAIKFSASDSRVRFVVSAANTSVLSAVKQGALPSGTRLLEFVVSDSGKGIPDEQQSELFTHLSTLSQETKNSYGGSGLGLSLAKELIDRLGGEVKLESEVGVGASFTVYVPVAVWS